MPRRHATAHLPPFPKLERRVRIAVAHGAQQGLDASLMIRRVDKVSGINVDGDDRPQSHVAHPVTARDRAVLNRRQRRSGPRERGAESMERPCESVPTGMIVTPIMTQVSIYSSDFFLIGGRPTLEPAMPGAPAKFVVAGLQM